MPAALHQACSLSNIKHACCPTTSMLAVRTYLQYAELHLPAGYLILEQVIVAGLAKAGHQALVVTHLQIKHERYARWKNAFMKCSCTSP
eukprot:1157722-Pelagomonas_calceolata.AAC.2